MKKQHNTWKIVLSCLLSIFIVLALFCGVMLYKLGQGMQSIAQTFTQLDLSDGQNSGVEISDDQKMIRFYQTLVNEIGQYGDLNQTQDESARLMELILERTIKNCQIQSVEYETDGLVITASGKGIAIDSLNESFLSKSAAKAGLSYLKDNLGTAFSSIFKGEEGIKSMLYGGYANELLDTLSNEIDTMPEQDVTYRIHVGIEEGKWLIRSFETNPENSTSSSSRLPGSAQNDSAGDSASSQEKETLPGYDLQDLPEESSEDSSQRSSKSSSESSSESFRQRRSGQDSQSRNLTDRLFPEDSGRWQNSDESPFGQFPGFGFESGESV